MKLRLTAKQGVQVLEVLEALKPEHASVLTTGIQKLLQTGKNRIVINLIEAKQLSVEILQKLIPLHEIASELNGGIVFVGQGDLVKQALQSLPKPVATKYFNTVDAAMQSFIEATMAQAAPGSAADSQLKAALEKLEAENKSLKGKLQSINPDDLKKFRSEHAELKARNQELEEQLRVLLSERKKPADFDSYQAKIEQLEAALKQALDQNEPEDQKATGK